MISCRWQNFFFAVLAPILLAGFLACGRNGNVKNNPRIQYVFVLMMENRSYDHILGLSKLTGEDSFTRRTTTANELNGTEFNEYPPGTKYTVSSTLTKLAITPDVPHEFEDVLEQLGGAEVKPYDRKSPQYPTINNSGFASRYGKVPNAKPGDAMSVFDSSQLPILNKLAKEFAVADNWYSSVPGPTWPNRLFVHAASSAGLDYSPTTKDIFEKVLIHGYDFENGTLFQRIESKGLNWRVYYGDFPQVLSIKGMNSKLILPHFSWCSLLQPQKYFSRFDDFSADMKNPCMPDYVFIEPTYDIINDYKNSDSMHAPADVTKGEALIKKVYETIRNSSYWEQSLLIIVFDEHGGFYDHVRPPVGVIPGDFKNPSLNQRGFDFSQLGVRVPAVLISPFIPKGTIDHSQYDHASIPAIVEEAFGLAPMTQRDKRANTPDKLLTLDTPRKDTPTELIMKPDVNDVPGNSDHLREKGSVGDVGNGDADPDFAGFLHVAFLAHQAMHPEEKPAALAQKMKAIKSNNEAKSFMVQVMGEMKDAERKPNSR